MSRFHHFVAIDWSGAVGKRLRGIAVATCGPGTAPPVLLRPDTAWSRQDVTEWLLHDMPDDTLVGLDLGCSLPFVDQGAYFPDWRDSPADARALWALVDRVCDADPHLAASAFVDHPVVSDHFRRHGGRKGQHFEGRGRLRVTEHAQRAQGLNPYSNLNLVGAAQVGKSSLTGMRVLHRIAGRIPIWPFDPLPAAGSVVVEIYTSIAAIAAGRRKGRSKIRDGEELDEALVALGSEPVRHVGVIDDHRSDAILSSAWLREHAGCDALWARREMSAEVARTEGWTFGIA